MANRFGFDSVTEGSILSLTGTNVTTADQLVAALSSQTGRPFGGGVVPVPAEDTARFVNGLNSQGQRPFLALFYGPNASPRDGHWGVVEGLTANGNIAILDPAGLRYTMTPTAFFDAWR